MNTSDAMPLMFLVHFQEARLQELENRAKLADTPDLRYFQTTTNNPQLSTEIDRQRQLVIRAQSQLDRLVLQSSSDLSHSQIDDALRSLEAYQNQAIISRWARSRRAIADLMTQIQYLRSQNELIQKQLGETKKPRK